MPKKQPQLAKLSRPRLHKPVARERLFRLLDEKRGHPVVWISGPPGAGKTTLAASYLEEAGVSAIWYQVDPGDSDPATFFHYLKLAIDHTAHAGDNSLPVLTFEYLGDVPAFARQFLRNAFSRLPHGTVMVLDNYQELHSGSPVHDALRSSLAEIPDSANILAISRGSPPAAYAEALVNKLVAVVSWDDLRLTPEETTSMATRSGVTAEKTLLELHDRSGGWMAGLTLMLENLRSSQGLDGRAPQAQDTLFSYFANLIFSGASLEAQDVILETSFLPWIDSRMADLATGISGAIRHVEDLHRRHLFTDRRAGAASTYQYHALFRAFLQKKANEELPLAIRQSIRTRTAAELLSTGHPDEAFALFLEAEHWVGAESVVLGSAEALARQGRWQTLGEWIGALPRTRLEGNPWIGYWHGRSATYLNPKAAGSILTSAYRHFLDSEDKVGQLLVATTMLEGIYFSFEKLKPMDPWIDCVVGLLQQGVRAPTKEDDLRVHSVVMVGASLRAPMHSMLPICLQRVVELLKEPFEPNLKISVASMLHGYSNIAMDADAERVATEVARPLLQSRDLSPIRALFYLTTEGYSHYVRGRHAEAFKCFDAADAVVEQHEIRDVNVVSTVHGRGLCERRAGLLDQAEATVVRADSLPLPATGHHRGRLLLMKSVVAFDRGDIQRAIELGLNAYNTYDDAGFFNGLITVGTVLANMAIAGNRLDLAGSILDRLRSESYGDIAQNYLAAIVLNQAWLQHRRDDPGQRDVFLRDALQRATLDGARIRFHWYMNALSELLPVAIAESIEKEMAIGLVREFRVVPTPGDQEEWPWPVRIRTLGAFELHIDGVPREYSRKAPKKVLALLKAIIAFGGSDVPEKRLTDALWPEDDGDSARRSLTATLHRLRKLLSHADAVIQTESRLSLNPRLCWVDALAAARAADSREGHIGADPLFRLYRGSFLEQEEDMPWVLPMRESLRAKFIRAVGRNGELLETKRRYEEAAEIYQRGIDADSLVESFYQGLMRCLDRLDRKAEAASTYRRLRQTLSVTLGVQPSVASQRLFDSLRAG